MNPMLEMLNRNQMGTISSNPIVGMLLQQNPMLYQLINQYGQGDPQRAVQQLAQAKGVDMNDLMRQAQQMASNYSR